MADAQFAIDIAANMPGGAATTAELDALSEKLLAGGKNSDVLSRGISQISRQLDVARSSASAAKAELDSVQSTFKGLEKDASAAEKAAAKYAAQAGDSRKEFDVEQMAKLRTEAARARAALEAHATTLSKVKERSRLAAAEEQQHTATLANLQKLNTHVNGSFARRAEALGKVQAAVTQLGGPIGPLAGRFVGAAKASQELTGALGASRAAMILGVAGAVAVTAAVALLTVAVIAGTVALTAYAIKQADAARSAELTTQAVQALNPALRGLPLEEIADRTGVAEDKLLAMAKQLKGAGVSAKDLPVALRAAATAEAALDGGGADALIAKMQATGKGARAAGKEIEKQLGGIAQKKLLGLTAQSARFDRNMRGLFDGLDIEPALRGLAVLVGLFDESTVSGKALKFLIGGIFGPLIEHTEQAAQAIEAFALGFMIGLVKLYIMAKPAIKKIKELLGFEDKDAAFAKALDMAEIAGKALAIGATILAVALLGVVAALTLLAAVPFVVIGAFMALGYGIAWVVDWAIGKFGELVDWFGELDFGQIASDLLMGFVNGMKAGAGWVRDATVGVFNGAVDAAKKALGIASPSKVTAGIADDSVDGYVNRMDRRAPEANDALESAVAPKVEKGSAADRGFSSGRGGGGGPNFSGANFNFYGVKGAEDAQDRFEDLLTLILEGDAATLSGALEEASP